RFARRAMVHPDDRVALRRAGRADRKRAPGMIEHNERAGGVEAEATEALERQPARRDRLADRGANRAPDVVGGVFDDVARLAPDLDRAPRAGEELARRVEDAGARAARADVDPDIGFPRAQAFLADCARCHGGAALGKRIPTFPSRGNEAWR